jgi:hypothetical protein
MTSFGASGPFKALYEHFGLTAEHVARKVRARLGTGPGLQLSTSSEIMWSVRR